MSLTTLLLTGQFQPTTPRTRRIASTLTPPSALLSLPPEILSLILSFVFSPIYKPFYTTKSNRKPHWKPKLTVRANLSILRTSSRLSQFALYHLYKNSLFKMTVDLQGGNFQDPPRGSPLGFIQNVELRVLSTRPYLPREEGTELMFRHTLERLFTSETTSASPSPPPRKSLTIVFDHGCLNTVSDTPFFKCLKQFPPQFQTLHLEFYCLISCRSQKCTCRKASRTVKSRKKGMSVATALKLALEKRLGVAFAEREKGMVGGPRSIGWSFETGNQR